MEAVSRVSTFGSLLVVGRQQPHILSGCQRRSIVLASNTAADRKEVFAVYRSAPQTTMRARPKDRPKAPNSSF